MCSLFFVFVVCALFTTNRFKNASLINPVSSFLWCLPRSFPLSVVFRNKEDKKVLFFLVFFIQRKQPMEIQQTKQNNQPTNQPNNKTRQMYCVFVPFFFPSTKKNIEIQPTTNLFLVHFGNFSRKSQNVSSTPSFHFFWTIFFLFQIVIYFIYKTKKPNQKKTFQQSDFFSPTTNGLQNFLELQQHQSQISSK